MRTKDKLSITLPPDLVADLRAAALRDHRTLSGQVAYFLSLAVGQYKANQDKEVMSCAD